jgi:hypothetical protein
MAANPIGPDLNSILLDGKDNAAKVILCEIGGSQSDEY